MPLQEFWARVRSAASMISPKAFADSPKTDAGQIQETLRKADIWLTPRAVAGFNRKDFDFLSEQEQNDLIASVDQFVAIAKDVPNDKPASTDQVEEALLPFSRIVEILNPRKYADLDSFVIGKKIERSLEGDLPGWVRGLRFESGLDSIGEPAVWIWVEMDDSATRDDVFSQNIRPARELLDKAVRQIAPDRWPHIRFRSVSEQQAISK